MMFLLRLSIIFFCVIMFPYYVHSSMQMPWSSTFNYSECTQRGAGGQTDCADVQNDGITWSWGADGVGGNYTQVSASANYPEGGGGNGARFWVGDGRNVNSGPIRIDFPSHQKELWIRWYMRYQQGFQWDFIGYNKTLYLTTDQPGISVIPSLFDDVFSIHPQGTGVLAETLGFSEAGWDQTYGPGTSDGSWHCFEIYIKMDTQGAPYNGVARFWLNGILKGEYTNANFSNGYSAARNGWTHFIFNENQNSVSNANGPIGASVAYVDYDDMAIYNTTPLNIDAHGNPFIGPIEYSEPDDEEPAGEFALLFEENFEDSNLAGRGWYDNTSPILTSLESAPGSSRSIEFHFPSGATMPAAGGAMRKKFEETESIYVSYYVKYSSNWQGSNRSYHPHELYLLTNKDGDWSGLANTHLTAYIEQNALRPRLAIQDARNIDLNNIGINLVDVTEYRGVAGCNGDSDGHGSGQCYSVGGGNYSNGKSWTADNTIISAGTWHKVEAYLKLNSISNGQGVADGVLKYWLNGDLIMNYNNVTFRTAEHADMKFNQFVIAPWIGDGSPVAQTFWVDNLTVATASPVSGDTDLAPPTGLQLTPAQ
jgi:hypothetical protein